MAPSRGGGRSWEKFFLVREKQNICEKFDMKQLNGSQKITLGRVIGMCKFFFFFAQLDHQDNILKGLCKAFKLWNKQTERERDNLTD